MIRSFARAASAAAILIVTAAPAFAHITLETRAAVVGGGYKAVLRVPHGCEGNATTAIAVKIPEGYIGVKPTPKAGWTLELTSGPYAAGHQLYGATVSEGVTTVTWSGGNLPDAYYDEFVLSGTLAADLAAGTKLYFPVVQTCTSGEDDWIDTSGAESERPAPSLTLTAPAK